MSIPFVIPAEYLARVAGGELIRYGAILKDAHTGQIVAHLQETGVVQNLLKTGLSFNPASGSVASLIGVAQNAIISKKLDALQAMMGTMQTLQIATLASSVIGIGVTAAGTALIIERLNVVGKTLEEIEGSVASLPAKWREMDLRNKIVNLKTTIERLQEAEFRPDAASVMQGVEERLAYIFDELHQGTCSIVLEVEVDARVLQTMLAALSLCGNTQIKSLLWLDMKEAAEFRARQQCSKLQDLAFLMPRDVMADRLEGGAEQALSFSQDCSEIRMRLASQPALVRSLVEQDIDGRAFVERVQDEDGEPLLILPAKAA